MEEPLQPSHLLGDYLYSLEEAGLDTQAVSVTDMKPVRLSPSCSVIFTIMKNSALIKSTSLLQRQYVSEECA